MNDTDEIARIIDECGSDEWPDEATELRLSDKIREYGRRKKIDGARSLAKMGDEMRRTQKRYFEFKDRETLAKSKKLEERFDAAVKTILEFMK